MSPRSTLVDEVGDTVIMAYSFEDDDGVAVNVPDGATFQMMWRTSAHATGDPLVDETGTVDTATVTFTVTAAETRALGAGIYTFDVQRTLAGVVETFDRGTIELRQDNTR